MERSHPRRWVSTPAIRTIFGSRAPCQPILDHKPVQANAGIVPRASYMHICGALSALEFLVNQAWLKQLCYLLLASCNVSRMYNAKGSSVESVRSRPGR